MTTSTFGQEVCEALGLNPAHVVRVTIEATAAWPPVVTVQYVPGTEEANLLGLIKSYRLERDEPTVDLREAWNDERLENIGRWE